MKRRPNYPQKGSIDMAVKFPSGAPEKKPVGYNVQQYIIDRSYCCAFLWLISLLYFFPTQK